VDEDRQSVDGGAGDALRRPPDGVDLPQHDDELPPDLRNRLEATATAWGRGEITDENYPPPGLPVPSTLASRRSTGWYAAAACCVLAIAGWWPRLSAQWPDGMWLMAQHGAAADRWSWHHEAGMETETHGEVVWDNVRQEGYVKIGGLPPTGTHRKQYQLWIYDAARDDRYPVAAGIFDVPAGAAYLTVPIRPALRIARPVAFAVTLEPAGGVVVPDSSHLVAMARAGAR
jgi:hypothetical protein